MRRVAQAYVIATNTKLDLGDFKLPERLTDDFFKREPRKKKRSEDMFEDTQEVPIGYFCPLINLFIVETSYLIFHYNSFKGEGETALLVFILAL